MPMSTDVVEFDLPMRFAHRSYSACEKFYELIENTLGISRNEVQHNFHSDTIRVRCRPSQFARFIIKRNELGFQNGIKELNAALIEDAPVPKLIDVVKRNRRDYEQ